MGALLRHVFLGSLWRRRLATSLSLLAIALGVALGLAVQLIHAAALDEFGRGMRLISGEADLQVVGPQSGFDDGLYPLLAQRPEVAEASPVLEIEARLPGRVSSLRILGIDLFRAARLTPSLLPLVAGRSGEAAPHQGAPTITGDVRLDALQPDALFASPAAATHLTLVSGTPLRVQVGTRETELRLAGLRLKPRTNGPSRGGYVTGLTLKRVDDLSERPITGLPADARISGVRWSPDGSRFAFVLTGQTDITLWTAAVADGKAKQLTKRPLNTADSGRILDLLIALPHGVAAMSTEIKGLVETSNNEASVRIANSKLEIVTSQRSSVMSRLHALTWRIEAIARLAGADAVSGNGYPAWQPNLQSPLLARCKDVYRKLFGKEPHVEAIHAGLECGIIGDKKEGMDMISFGPTLKNPHSPDEKIHVESIGKVWDFMVELLKSLK